ncbi:MAG TPA: hypothetical protein VE944_32920 [Nostoc sp.]|uniref:hypothetical protein n=1 Tax=Nostoc sp. TaxID=1180 RepID=UPI002D339E43|nr:hypothetical protein [Nostoc sp.]HYX19072.1 hypothetical protein [Nostoc sp.]
MVTIPPRDKQGRQLPPTSNISTGETLTPTKPGQIVPKQASDNSLPNNFNAFEHLQAVYIPQHNALVKRYFSDHPTNWQPNIATSRSSLRVACTMLDSDNQLMMNLRHHLFFDLLGYGRKNLSVFYGSIEDSLPSVSGHPRILFYFSQDSQSMAPTQTHRADAEYSVRLMKLTNTSPELKTKLIEIANEIKTQFIVNGQGIVLVKGKLGIVYNDPVNGFYSGRRVLANTEADGIDIYQRMCNVIDAPFDNEKITVTHPKKPSSIGPITQTQIIMGKVRYKPAYRRVVSVRFRYAYAEIPGEPHPVFLIDTTSRYNPLVNI